MILIAKHIAKSFGRKNVLTDITFQLERGSITGIVGENGSGKTVLMEIIVGLRKAQSGTIFLKGRLGYCPQKILLFPQLTVREHLDYFSKAYGISKIDTTRQSDQLLEQFRFGQYYEEKIINLSGGTQQKLNLALALLHKPDLLILDEPYNGFDWDTYLRFWDYSIHLRKQGCAILIVTHLLGEKARIDRIYELQNGVLI